DRSAVLHRARDRREALVLLARRAATAVRVQRAGVGRASRDVAACSRRRRRVKAKRGMNMRLAVRIVALMAALTLGTVAAAQGAAPRIYNTAKLKLERGERVIGGTVTVADPEIYCAMASSGFDFLW